MSEYWTTKSWRRSLWAGSASSMGLLSKWRSAHNFFFFSDWDLKRKKRPYFLLIVEVFSGNQEERIIANKIKKEMDKIHGKSQRQSLMVDKIDASNFKLDVNQPFNVETDKFLLPLGESWNCIVGKNFGSHVIHQTGGYLFCNYRDEISILLWKSSWTALILQVYHESGWKSLKPPTRHQLELRQPEAMAWSE